MPSLLNKLWKLKASVVRSSSSARRTAGYLLLQEEGRGGGGSWNFGNRSNNPLFLSSSSSSRYHVFAFSFWSRFFTKTRSSSAAGKNHSSAVSAAESSSSVAARDCGGGGGGVSSTEAVSRVFATPSVHGPLLQSRNGYSSLDGGEEGSGGGSCSRSSSSCSLREFSEKSCFLVLTGDHHHQPGSERFHVETSSGGSKSGVRVLLSSQKKLEAGGKERRWRRDGLLNSADAGIDFLGGGLGFEGKEERRWRDDVAVLTSDHAGNSDVGGGLGFETRTSVLRIVDGGTRKHDEDFDGGRTMKTTEELENGGATFYCSGDDQIALEKFAIGGGAPRRTQQHFFNWSSSAFPFSHFIGSSLPAAATNIQHVRLLHDLHASADFSTPGSVSNRNHEPEILEGQERNPDQTEGNIGALRLLSGACCLPHPNKIQTGGEDAYFICSDKQVVGVADGVGGWAELGVDAGEYARELMSQSLLAVRQEPHGYIDPARIMRYAHSKTKCPGSSTACILALSDNGLEAANLGDSGFLLMRDGSTIFKSPVQQHQFNIPFQLESGGSDPPSAAEVFSLQVAAGDVIVAGTDGLFDNLYDNELVGVVIHATRAGLGPQVTAQKIVALARERAEDRDRQTPFSLAAQEAGYRFYGGKLDDITVVVSYITNAKSLQLNSSQKS
ncbi:hypothetical protein BDL97_12G054800 [Sphagnum fallax]|nr:hypothetical protein BDL97_12G054800 [Sphagnum fallax]KAH8945719.1 hypothetical protein BDL97_12G054800 [Sphagnum fallax]